MRKWIFSACLVVVFLVPIIAIAEQGIPDLIGTWTCERQGIKMPPVKPGTGPDPLPHTKPGFVKTEFTFAIEKQTELCFSGTLSSPMNNERFVGCIGLDHKSVHMADQDGTYQGALIGPDKMELYYLEARGDHGATAAILILHRKE